MRVAEVFLRRDGALRVWTRVLVFLAATALAGAFAGLLVLPLLSATPVASWARALGIPLDRWADVLALAIGTWVALRVDAGRGDLPDRVRAERAARSRGAGGAFTPPPHVAWSRVHLGAASRDPRSLALGAVIGTLGILVPCALLLAAGYLRFTAAAGTASWLRAAALTAFALAPAAAAEELAVRGYLLTVLRDVWRAPTAVLATSAIFAVLHLFNPEPTVLSTLVVGLAGVLLASVRLATRSLYAAMAAHFAWNFVQAAVLHAPVSGIVLPETGYRTVSAGPAWLTGGTWGPEGGAAAAAALLVATFLLVRGRREPAAVNAVARLDEGRHADTR